MEMPGKSGCGLGGGGRRWVGTVCQRGRFRSVTVAVAAREEGGQEMKSCTLGNVEEVRPWFEWRRMVMSRGQQSERKLRLATMVPAPAATRRRELLREEELHFRKCWGSQAAIRVEEDDVGSRTMVRKEGSGWPQQWQRRPLEEERGRERKSCTLGNAREVRSWSEWRRTVMGWERWLERKAPISHNGGDSVAAGIRSGRAGEEVEEGLLVGVKLHAMVVL